MRKHAGFPAAGARKNKHRAIGLPNGGGLHVVKCFGFEEHFRSFDAGLIRACMQAKVRRPPFSSDSRRAASDSGARPSHMLRRAVPASIPRPCCD